MSTPTLGVMLRKIHLRRHLSVSFHRQFCTFDKKSLESQLNDIGEYKEGKELIAKGQYEAASSRLERVIEILELSSQQNNPIYSHLLQKAGSVLLKQEGQYKRIEVISNKLAGALQMTQGETSDSTKQAIRNAFLAALNFDLNKANQHLQKLQEIPEFELFQASLKILEGQSGQAIGILNSLVERLEKSEQQHSNSIDISEILYRALNNLGVAKWQEEYPQFNHLNITGGDNLQHKEPSIQTALFFKQALLVKNKNMKGNKIYELFANSPDIMPTQHFPRIDFYFDAQGSDVSLRAISDYLLDAHHAKRLEHTIWTKFYLKHHEMHDREHLYRPLMSIAHHCGISHMLLKSEGLFNTAISMLQDNKTIEKPICNYFFSNTISQIDKREEEAQQIKKSARRDYQQNFPAWNQWQLYLDLPKPSFLE